MHDLSSRASSEISCDFGCNITGICLLLSLVHHLLSQIFVPKASPKFFLSVFICLESSPKGSLWITNDCHPSIWSLEQTHVEWSWIQPASQAELLHGDHARLNDTQSINVLWAWEEILMNVSYQVGEVCNLALLWQRVTNMRHFILHFTDEEIKPWKYWVIRSVSYNS